MNRQGWVVAGLRGLSSLLREGHRAISDAERVCRFMSGRMEFEPRPSDLYVATYPRSGTTWVQFILFLMHDERDPEFAHISQVSPWYERSLALATKEARDFEPYPDPRYFKTHLTPEWLPDVGRVIYIERDPLDVAVSYYHLYRSHLRFRGSFDQFFDRFIDGRLQYRSWFDHVERWRRFGERHPDRILSLTYEDLRTDLDAVVMRIAAFTGASLTPRTTERIRRMANFEWMRTHQRQFDPITETHLDQGLIADAFIRSGRSGEGRATLDAEQRARFQAARRARREPRRTEWRIHDFLH